MRSEIVPGATFPDYELPDHTRVPRRLSELQRDDRLILTLARSYYCPKVRPDWDLGASGLREAWDAGDLSPFHGSNKRAPAARPAPL